MFGRTTRSRDGETGNSVVTPRAPCTNSVTSGMYTACTAGRYLQGIPGRHIGRLYHPDIHQGGIQGGYLRLISPSS